MLAETLFLFEVETKTKGGVNSRPLSDTASYYGKNYFINQDWRTSSSTSNALQQTHEVVTLE